jgi:hypothetical protein
MLRHPAFLPEFESTDELSVVRVRPCNWLSIAGELVVTRGGCNYKPGFKDVE